MIRVSEHFYTIQGEGLSAGVPSYFIRIPGCNLMCGGHDGIKVKEGKATWHCDTEAVWRKSINIEPLDIILNWQKLGIFDDIISGRVHLIFTGGEPLLPMNTKYIYEFLNKLTEYCGENKIEYNEGKLYIEIETNGTQLIEVLFHIDQINCSPKLINSGNDRKMRIVPYVIESLINHKNSWFKFVVTKKEDMDEIMNDFIIPYKIPLDKIILMPGMTRRDEFFDGTKLVFDLAKEYKVRAMPRLHIAAWDQTVGV